MRINNLIINKNLIRKNMRKGFDLMNKRNLNHVLAATLFGCMGILSACTEDETFPDTGNIETEKIEVNNDVTELNKRVSLYSRGTAVEGQERILPEPDVDLNKATDMMDEKFQAWAPEGEFFVLKQGQEKTISSLNLSGKDNAPEGKGFYIQGTLTLDGFYGKGKIFVLNGGKLILPQNKPLDNIQIYQYQGGIIEQRDDNMTINENSIVTVDGDFEVKEHLQLAGQLIVYSTLNVGKIEGLSGGELYAEDMNIEQESTVDGSNFYINNRLTAKKLKVTSKAIVTVGCSAIFDTELYITNTATFNALSYLESPKTTIDSQAQINVNGNGLLKLGNFTNHNANTAAVNVMGETYAVVDAERIHANATDLTKAFTGFMGLHYRDIQTSNDGNPVKFQSQVLVNDDDDTYIPETGCHPAYGTDPDAPTEPEENSKIVIEHIGSIESPDHEHNISATCVQMVGNNVYVSYHQQGTGYSGCAEVFTFDTPETFQLRSFVRSEVNRDFNHLLIDNNTLYLVGGEQKKGAFLASIPLTNGIFNSGNADELSLVRITNDNKEADDDANCIIRNGNNYQVASNMGFRTLDAETMEITHRKNTNGSGKFIHMNGDKFATLNLTQRGVEESGAEINVFNASDYSFDSPVVTISESTITPIDGKNVCMTDGENIYVCCGKNGLKRYTNGTLNGEFKRDGDALVNGMTFDENYIYVAYGNRGLWVLDKNTLEKVAHYTHGAGSANYVTVANGYIYVAYGTNGLEVFRLATVER